MIEPDIPRLQAGDILLLNGRKRPFSGNRFLQSVVTLSAARYSHVAFSCGAGEFIHADKVGNVENIFVDDLLARYPGEWRGMRNAQIDRNNLEYREKLVLITRYYLGQQYLRSKLPLIFGKTPYGENYCSHLANEILRKLSPNLAIIKSKPLPIHFQRLSIKDGWTDVTASHMEAIGVIEKNPSIKAYALLGRELAAHDKISIELAVRDYNSLAALFEKMAELDQKFGLKIPKAKLPKFSNFELEYWDVQTPSDSSIA